MSFRVFRKIILAIICVAIGGAGILVGLSGIGFGKTMYDVPFMEVTYQEFEKFVKSAEKVEGGLFSGVGQIQTEKTECLEYSIKESKKEIISSSENEGVVKVAKVNDKWQLSAIASEVYKGEDGETATVNTNVYYADGFLYEHEKNVTSISSVERKVKHAYGEEFVEMVLLSTSLLESVESLRAMGIEVKFYLGYNGSYTLYKVEFEKVETIQTEVPEYPDPEGEPVMVVKEETFVFGGAMTVVYNEQNQIIGVRSNAYDRYTTSDYETVNNQEVVVEIYEGAIELPSDLSTYQLLSSGL